MYGYIYLTTNLTNGKKYIGQHKSEIFDESYIGSGKRLAWAIKKYGKGNFSCKILEQCESLNVLNDREKYWISFYNAVEDETFYNIANGGYGTHEASAESKEIMASLKRGRPAHNKGIPASEESKEINRQKHLGKKSTIETREKISLALKGHPTSDETKQKLSLAKKGHPSKLKGKSLPEEVKQKIKDIRKQQGMSEEHKYKLYLLRKKSVQCIETGEIFESLDLAGKAVGLKSGYTISLCCKGLQGTAKKLHWKYVD